MNMMSPSNQSNLTLRHTNIQTSNDVTSLQYKLKELQEELGHLDDEQNALLTEQSRLRGQAD